MKVFHKHIILNFFVKLNKNSVSLEILYTPGYSKVDAYGIKGIIYKQNNVFLYKYTENKNLLDYFSVAIVAFFSIMFVYVWVTEGLRESTLCALIMLIALLIISSLFYMRKRILRSEARAACCCIRRLFPHTQMRTVIMIIHRCINLSHRITVRRIS